MGAKSETFAQQNRQIYFLKELFAGLGKTQRITKKTDTSKNRFCDKMSSHMMRRTAITTLLILGMPEHLVRKISGHSHASTSFNRYVHYAQAYMDKEIEKVYSKLESY